MRRRTVSLDVFEPSEIKIAANFMSGKQRKWFHSRTSFFLGGVALFSLSRAPHHVLQSFWQWYPLAREQGAQCPSRLPFRWILITETALN